LGLSPKPAATKLELRKQCKQPLSYWRLHWRSSAIPFTATQSGTRHPPIWGAIMGLTTVLAPNLRKM
jgi:predicted metal-binding membrane protein